MIVAIIRGLRAEEVVGTRVMPGLFAWVEVWKSILLWVSVVTPLIS
jgi:hypothetical protein